MQYPCHNSAIKREEEKSLESSLDEAMADSSLDTPVSPKPGMNIHLNNNFSSLGNCV